MSRPRTLSDFSKKGKADMTYSLDGTYSVVGAGVAGVSAAVCVIQDGRLIGNDTGGCRYSGTVVEQGDEIRFTVTMSMLPGTLGIWGSSEAETWQSIDLDISISKDQWGAGEPVYIPSQGSYFIFRLIGDEYAVFAQPGGFKLMGEYLLNADRQWAER